MKKITLGVVLFLASFSFCLSHSFGADATSAQESGPQAERFQKDLQREKEQLERSKPRPAKIVVPQEKEKPVAAGVSFVLKEVKITGSSLFSPEELKPAYQAYLNKTVNFKDIELIIKNIKEKYRQKGYLTTDAYLPEQQISGGSIEIRIIESKMGKFTIEGMRQFSEPFISKWLHAKKNEVLNVNDLERDILRLNKFSDLEARVVLSAGKEPQTSDVTVQIKDNFPWHAGIGFDNRGTRLSGKYRNTLYLRSGNLSGQGDSFFLNTIYNADSFGESVSYSLPVGTYGTKFNVDATYFKMKLGKEYKANHIRGITQIYSPHMTWELALQENFEAYFDTGIDIKCIKKKTLGELTSDDNLRLPYFSFDITRNDPSGITAFSPRFTFGTSDFLGASRRNHPSASREGTGGFFFKPEFNLRRYQKMPWESYLIANSQFQFASRTLAPSEQLQLGGAYSVRGYPEGDYLADVGGLLSLDWIFPMYLFPRDWKLVKSNQPLREVVRPVILFDVGRGKLKKFDSAELKDKTLMGVGAGLRFNFFNKIYIRLECTKRLGDRPAGGGGSATFNISFQSEI